ncbi:hypothetical protein ACJX0J_039724 [Zea mays]
MGDNFKILLMGFIGIPPDIAPDNHKGGAAPNVIGSARDRGSHGHSFKPTFVEFLVNNKNSGPSLQVSQDRVVMDAHSEHESHHQSKMFTLCNKSDAFKWVLAVVYGPAQVDKKELFLAELLDLKQYITSYYKGLKILTLLLSSFQNFTKVLTNRLSDIANNLR